MTTSNDKVYSTEVESQAYLDNLNKQLAERKKKPMNDSTNDWGRHGSDWNLKKIL